MPSQKKSAIIKTMALNPKDIHFEDLEAIEDLATDLDFKRLKKSIKQHGLLSNILVKEEFGKVYVVAGKRRLLAAKQLELDEILCSFIDFDNGLYSLIENTARKKYTAMQTIDDVSILKHKYNVGDKELIDIFGKILIDTSNALIENNISDRVKMKIRYDERISINSIAYILKNNDDELSIESSISDFIAVLDKYVPQPLKRKIKQIEYYRSNRYIFDSLHRACFPILYKIDGENSEESSELCRNFITILNGLLLFARKKKKQLPKVTFKKKVIKLTRRRRVHKFNYENMSDTDMVVAKLYLIKEGIITDEEARTEKLKHDWEYYAKR